MFEVVVSRLHEVPVVKNDGDVMSFHQMNASSIGLNAFQFGPQIVE